MSKFYTTLEITRISSTASLTILGTVSNGFEFIYPKNDGFLYHVTNDLVERRLGHDTLLGCGLTYSFILENSIAPYGSVLSLNLGPGMTFSNCELVVSCVTASQICTNNTPTSDDVLGYDGVGLTWKSKLPTIEEIAAIFGIDCGVDYIPTPTYSIVDGVYNIGIYCQFIGTTTTTTEEPTTTTTTEVTTSTTTTTTCSPSDITPDVNVESDIITFNSVTYDGTTTGSAFDPDGIEYSIFGFPLIINPIPSSYDGLSGWIFNIDGDPCSPYNIVVEPTTTTTTEELTTTTTTEEPTTTTTTEEPTTTTTTEEPTTTTTTEEPTTTTTTEEPTTTTTTEEIEIICRCFKYTNDNPYPVNVSIIDCYGEPGIITITAAVPGNPVLGNFCASSIAPGQDLGDLVITEDGLCVEQDNTWECQISEPGGEETTTTTNEPVIP